VRHCQAIPADTLASQTPKNVSEPHGGVPAVAKDDPDPDRRI